MSVIVDPYSCQFPTLASTLASGASIIYVKPGTYTESITLSNVTIYAETGVFINNLTVLNATLIGGTYSNLTTLGNVVITNATVSLTNTGILEITKSKILSLTNNNCASIYNNYIFAPIVSTGGTLNIAENVFCSVSNLLSASNTTARVLSNTVINNSEFTAYTADATSVIQSSNNTFRTGPTNTISNSTAAITNDDAWIGDFPINNNPLNAYNVNGNNVINAQYTATTTVTSAYATTADDHTIVVEAPGGDVTLSPTNDGQVIYVRNNSPSTIDVNGTPIDPNTGAIFTYANGAWQLVGAVGAAPVPPPPFYVNNSVFVDPVYGNNATAQPNNPALSATTIEYAVSIALNTDSMIYVQPGSYTPATGFTTNNFYFSPDAIVTWAAAGTLFGGTSNVYGYGIFNLSGAGTLFGGTNSIVTGETINQLVGSTGSVFNASNSVIKFNNYNPLTNSNFFTSVVDIKQTTLPDDDQVFFTLTDSSINLQLITSIYTGVPALSVFNTAGTTAVRADNIVMNGNPRRIVNVVGVTDLRIGTINSVALLGAGVGELTGYVGRIVNNNVEPIFNSALLEVNMTIDHISSTNASDFLITDSNLFVGTWIIDNSTCTNWDVVNSSLSVGNMLLTSLSVASLPLFVITANADINASYLNAVSGELFTVSGDLNLYLGHVIMDDYGVEPIIITGRVTGSIDRLDITGTVAFILNNSATESSFVINKHVGSTITTGTGSGTYIVNDLNNTAPAFGGATSGNLNITINGGRFGSTIANGGAGPINLTVSGYITAVAIALIILQDAYENRVHIKSLIGPGYNGTVIFILGIASPSELDQYVKIDNILIGTGFLLSHSTASRLVFEAENIVASPNGNLFNIISTGARNINININSIICNTGVITNLVFNNETNFRLNINEGRVNTLINVSGDAYIPGSNAGIFINVGNLSSGAPSAITAEANIAVSCKSIRSAASTIFAITGVNGTYMRFTGRYSVLGAGIPALTLTRTAIAANEVIEGLYLAHAEFACNANAITITIGANVGITVSYRFRVFSVITTGYTLTPTGAGTVAFVTPIEIPTIAVLPL